MSNNTLREQRRKILIVDDEAPIRMQFRLLLEDDYDIVEAANAQASLEVLQREPIDLILLDHMLPGMSGLELLKIIRHRWEEIDVLMVSGLSDMSTAVQAIKSGAFHYVTKGGDPAELRNLVQAALERRYYQRKMELLESELEEYRHSDCVPSRNARMQQVDRVVAQVASLPTTILILGESGTGKEVVARQIYRESDRNGRAFVRVNMASIPRDLVESTLFGHERGAFTGAVRQQHGKFELASGGVLFMDEVGELPLEVQTKLLRVIQEGEFERVGGDKTLPVDVRLIAATNKSLQQAVARGEFREDLYYRLNVVPLELPPLRERPEDIEALIRHFIHQFSHRFRRPLRDVSPDAMEVLKRYRWPGNIRELENLMERMVATVDRPCLETVDIPVDFVLQSMEGGQGGDNRLEEACNTFERNYILRALDLCGGHRNDTARYLGVPLSTLKYRMKKLGLGRRARNAEQRPRDPSLV